MADAGVPSGKPEADVYSCQSGRQCVGGEGVAPIGLVTVVGVPAYLNGYAALPLVGSLRGQGTVRYPLPAAIAVFALVRWKVFALYLGFALTVSFAAGVLFQLWTSV